ncbi:site-specific DNA-methyltransferase [Roseiarcaceae bacterium H3SJ34-1]|uniref:site-specific DNA-methyltransferase n=1 Tax=Terripilifer ovatus TaxID=3032367 RepID=UPI003AB99E44|nr:site-specific DNA-methyltransferase [Roseiarcaceae bacterium H3SJ34-1]
MSKSVSSLDLQVVLLPLCDLIPNPRNARVHNRAQKQALVKSYKTFGCINPLIIDQNRMILAGHGRLEAAKLAGLKEVPTITVTHLSDLEKRAFAISDNKLGDRSAWDFDMLADEIRLLQLDPTFDLSLTGFEIPEIDNLTLAQDDRPSASDTIPDIQEAVVSKVGDTWILGAHRLACGDARSIEDIARLMAGQTAGMIFTDPPYNIPVRYIGGRGKIKHQEFVCASGEMSRDEFADFYQTTIDNAVAVCRDGSLAYVCMDWRNIDVVIAASRAMGTELANICVWNKTNAGQGSFYRSQHEFVAVMKIGSAEGHNNVQLGRFGRNRTNVWTYAGVNSFGKGRKDLVLHPTVKPVAMIADAILDCTAHGDIVLDVFAGSASVALAAEKTGRRAFCLEFAPNYVDVAVRRWQRHTRKDAILEGDGRTFSEIKEVRNADAAMPQEPRSAATVGDA